jgi:hypothetical protein
MMKYKKTSVRLSEIHCQTSGNDGIAKEKTGRSAGGIGRQELACKRTNAGWHRDRATRARPRKVDLIAYIDLDDRIGQFIACPIQMKAATDQVFSFDPKYARFPGLLLAYVWNLADSSKTKCFVLTYLIGTCPSPLNSGQDFVRGSQETLTGIDHHTLNDLLRFRKRTRPCQDHECDDP